MCFWFYLDLGMANFKVQFLDSSDDESIFIILESKHENVNDIPVVDLDLEILLNTLKDSAVGSDFCIHSSDSEDNGPTLSIAEHYKPIVKDLSESDE